ncbi:MAG: FAD binding domain-containing protein [Candidatus Neomarinimicrobiota bacterium]
MKNINWYYPVSLSETSSLLEKESVVIHGGGTNLSGRDLSSVEGIICLKHLGLDSVKLNDETIEIGATSTYADVVKALPPEHILVKCLKNAANTPCRNKITLGGSIAFVPTWSDLIAALLALDAKLILAGKNQGELSLEDYLAKKDLYKKNLITAVKFKNIPHRSAHYRDAKTVNDMALFSVTVLLELDADVITSAKAYIVGTKELITRLPEVEAYLQGKAKADIDEKVIEDLVNVEIIGSRITDPDYMSLKAKIQTARTIISALEGD